MATSLPEIHLLPKHERRVQQGHPWIFSNEIRMDPASRALPPGGPVTIRDSRGRPLGTASFNPHSLICARILDRRPDVEIDEGWLLERLSSALGLRDRLFAHPCYRLVHAEADGLPGLVIDRFGDALAVQLNTAGMDGLREPLLRALDRLLGPRTVVLRNDSRGRALEGLPERIEVVRGAFDGPVPLVENGARFSADLLGGQKTGWFYDQRQNRAVIAGLSRGEPVLDAYSYRGGFGVLCAVQGASRVLCLDRSPEALGAVTTAAADNGVADRVDVLEAEAFSALEELHRVGDRFGVVISDPPAFARRRKDAPMAEKGYRKLARLSAALVRPGGFLLVGSCSHHVPPDRFAAEVARGIFEAGRTGRILHTGGAGPDHPVHPMLPESAYLKVQVLQLD